MAQRSQGSKLRRATGLSIRSCDRGSNGTSHIPCSLEVGSFRFASIGLLEARLDLMGAVVYSGSDDIWEIPKNQGQLVLLIQAPQNTVDDINLAEPHIHYYNNS